MIYISFSHCQSTYNSQHETAYSLLSDMLSCLGFNDISIKKDSSGRPYTDIENIDLSIAHSSEIAVVALITDGDHITDDDIVIPANGKRIGIDIEKIDRNADLVSKKRLSERFIGKRISDIDEFYRVWTKNEAYGKMTGEGVISKKDVPCIINSFIVNTDDSEYCLSISYI